MMLSYNYWINDIFLIRVTTTPGTDLYTLDAIRIMPNSVKNIKATAENMSKMQCQKFAAVSINANSTAFSDTIHKKQSNSVSFYFGKETVELPKSLLYDAVNLFSRMSLACQALDSDVFFFLFFFSCMRIIPGLHHSRQIVSCTHQRYLARWSAWNRRY